MEVCLLLAVLVLTVPLPWLGAAVAAAGIHELCHRGMMQLLGVRVLGLRVEAGGAVMDTEGMKPGQEIIAALAGPGGSLALTGLYRWCPRLAVCGAVQGIFNLLPVYPLDGGRALRGLLKLRYSEQSAARICKILENTVLWAILLEAVVLAFVNIRGIPWALAAFAMVMKAKMRKTPCKDGFQIVQ